MRGKWWLRGTAENAVTVEEKALVFVSFLVEKNGLY
jgi:hypothetical protein